MCEAGKEEDGCTVREYGVSTYPAFDQNSGPEVSGHLAKNRYVCFYSLLDGR